MPFRTDVRMPEKRKHPGRKGDRISLHGVTFEEAVDKLLEASPPVPQSASEDDHSQSVREDQRTADCQKSSDD